MFSSYSVAGESLVGRKGKLAYYEDVYGRRNPEEFDEGPIDRCESDSDDNTTGEPPRDTSLDPFATPAWKVAQSERSESIKAPSRRKAKASSKASPFQTHHKGPSEQASSTPTTKTSSKLLAPKKYGMFAAPVAEMQVPNSAGEALNDIANRSPDRELVQSINFFEESAGGARVPGDNLDSMEALTSSPGGPLPRESIEQSVDVLEAQPMPEGAGDMDGGGGGGGNGGRVVDAPLSLSEGDADESNSTPVPEPDKKSQRKKSTLAHSKVAAQPKQVPPTKSGYKLRDRVRTSSITSSASAASPRRSARHSGKSVLSPGDKGKQIAANNRSKMTARAMTLRDKAKKAPVDKEAMKQEYFRTVYGRKRKAKSDEASDEDGEKMSSASKSERKTPRRSSKLDVPGDEKLSSYFRAVYGRKGKGPQYEEAEGKEDAENEEGAVGVDEAEYGEPVEPETADAMEKRARAVVVSEEGGKVEEYERVD